MGAVNFGSTFPKAAVVAVPPNFEASDRAAPCPLDHVNRQFQAVMQHNAVVVHPRHTQLISEIMCHTGVIRPLGRFGVIREKGTYHYISHEESFEKANQAGVHAAYDGLEGVTENIIVAKPIRMGTTLNDVRPPPPEPLPPPSADARADNGSGGREQREVERLNFLAMCRRTLHATYDLDGDDESHESHRDRHERRLRERRTQATAASSVWDLVDPGTAPTPPKPAVANPVGDTGSGAAAAAPVERASDGHTAAAAVAVAGLSHAAETVDAVLRGDGGAHDENDDDEESRHAEPLYDDVDTFEMIHSLREQQPRATQLADRIEVRECGLVAPNGVRTKLASCSLCSNRSFLPICLSCLANPPPQHDTRV